MPDHGLGRVHRFRDHVVAGVNWRPTRFVDEVPNSRVCGLCCMIPKRTVLLPCGHALCESCHAASLDGGVGQCPLDQVQFEEAEGVGYEFPTRIASTLKVCCWNEAHGCEYTGTMDRMLEHYENACTFHTVDCLRCGERVQHKDLPTHYAAGCSAGVSSAITESSEHTALTLADVNDAVEDVKAMLGCINHDQLLPVIQSQLNELTEQVRGQGTRFAGITREIGAWERNLKGDMSEMAATISSTVSNQLTFLQSPEEEASTSLSLSLRSEMALILRKLELLADSEDSRQTSPKPDSSRVIAHCRTFRPGVRRLYSAMSTTSTWIKQIGTVSYDLTFENCEEIIQYQGRLRKKLAEITVWHMRDTYFRVAALKAGVGISGPALIVEIEFNGLLVNSRCWPPFWQVSVWDNGKRVDRWLTPLTPLRCSCYDDSLEHFHLEFYIEAAELNIDRFFEDGKIYFKIILSDEDMGHGIEGAP
ncbi:uncharacterized protein LOC142557387 isoform X1 [Dermacentor variabilis]|uniref:uncharacterized protein LOC142557387 isoform X1 n=1 Tax=Dermacentor variabilis TaxID=34621 RepID=UPI003F5BEE69